MLFAAPHESARVKVFGCRPTKMTPRTPGPAYATPKEETAGRDTSDGAACAIEDGVARNLAEGFRMPAHEDDATYTGAGVRKPPKEETAVRDTSDGAACAIEDGVARNFDS